MTWPRGTRSVGHEMTALTPHPRIPNPGQLGPDPEPLGTERFERLMRVAPGVASERRVAAEPVPLYPARPAAPGRKAA